MADFVNFQTELGMTDHQVLNEIRFMRRWEKFITKKVGEKTIFEWATEMAREETEEELKQLGATEEEINECIAYAEEGIDEMRKANE